MQSRAVHRHWQHRARAVRTVHDAIDGPDSRHNTKFQRPSHEVEDADLTSQLAACPTLLPSGFELQHADAVVGGCGGAAL